MEQVLEREATPKLNWRDIEVYDDDGKRVTNPKTLHAIAEGQELIAEWEKRIERYHIEDIFRHYEEDGEDFDSEEDEED